MQKLFGTDGIRAVAGTFPLDGKTVSAIGLSLARIFHERLGQAPRFVTGRDTRESGEWIEKAFHAGTHIGGAACLSAGVITTPGVAFLTRHFEFDAGIVISASHNPYRDNGIKIFMPSGMKLDAATERLIENEISGGENHVSPAVTVDASHVADYRSAYIDYLVSECGDLRFPDIKIVLDCANGAASSIAPELFQFLGASVTAINAHPNGRNINEGCGSLHLEGLSRKVVEISADLGIAFDGDADRCLFVDGSGRIVDGDAVLWILARYFADRGQLKDSKVVATVMSNVGLEIALASENIKLVRTAVGDKYVLEELLRSSASIGGEQSGHIIIPEKSLVGDGMMTAIFLLEALHRSDATLSEAVKGFTRYPQTLVNVKVRNKLPFDEVPAIATEAQLIERELSGSGRLLLRYSGTEDLARVMIEGKDQSSIDEQAQRLAAIIRSELG